MAIGSTPIMTADSECPSPDPIDCKRLVGREPLRDGGRALGFDVLAVWRWSTSDLVSNATRGVLAENLVAQALGMSDGCVREEWAACDLEAPDGTAEYLRCQTGSIRECERALSSRRRRRRVGRRKRGSARSRNRLTALR